MRAYSADLRARVLGACDDGEATSEVAERFAVSGAWVRRLKQRRAGTGEVAPRYGRPGPKPRLAAHADRLLALARETPGLTAGQYRALLGEAVAVVTVWRALRRLGLTHKKR